MKISNISLVSPVTLAPMAGVADRAFRELCVSYGASLVTGEMVSAKGIGMNDKKSCELLYLSHNERPAAVQLFGCEPDTMAAAAEKALEYEPEMIDINMGCPAPKVTSNGGGSSLMKNPELAAKIVEAVVKAVDIPVTVKMRAGWDEKEINAPYLAKICEQAGAAAVTVHGRTRAQMYAPPVNKDVIRDVKKAVSIPVIGNGDVTDGTSAKELMEYTGCDAVSVGRGALGRPWVFSMINAYLNDGTVLPEPTLEQRMSVMLSHIEKLCKYKGDYIGMREARKHSAWYIKGMRGAAALRNEIVTIKSIDDLRRITEKIILSAEI